MKRDSTIALLLLAILVFSALIYSLINYVIIEPARRMEDDLLQVATDMESKGDLNQAISTLEALYERRYCYKKCLSKLGVMENRRGGYPAALIFCRESLNTDRSKCSNIEALNCMINAYSALGHIQKLVTFQEHLLNCRKLPIEDSLPLLEHFLSTNATARALNLLTIYHMYEQAPEVVRANANDVMKRHGFRSLLRSKDIKPKSPSAVTNIAKEDNSVEVLVSDSSLEEEVVKKSESSAESFHHNTENTVDSSIDNRIDTKTSSIISEEPQTSFQEEILISVDDTLNVIAETDVLLQKNELKEDTAVKIPELDAATSIDNADEMAEIAKVVNDNSVTSETNDTIESAHTESRDKTDESPISQPVDSTQEVGLENKLLAETEPATIIASHAQATDSTSSLEPAIQQKEEKKVESVIVNAGPSKTLPPKRTPQQENQRRAAKSYVNMAQSYLQRGDVPLALKQVTLALKKAPNFEDALLLRGSIYLQQQEFQKATADFVYVYAQSEETRGNATAAGILCQLANYYSERQQPNEAVELYRILHENEQEQQEQLSLVQEQLSKSVEKEESKKEDETGAKFRCMDAPTILKYADLLVRFSQDYTTAISLLDKLQIELSSIENIRHRDSLRLQIRERYAKWLEQSGDVHRAEAFYEEAIAQGELTLLDYADICVRRNDSARAIEIYRSEENKIRNEVEGFERKVETIAHELRLLQSELEETTVPNSTEESRNDSTNAVKEDAVKRKFTPEETKLQRSLQQERQNLRRAHLMLGNLLKRLGHIYNVYVQDFVTANALYSQAMNYGVYDLDIRRYLANSAPKMHYELPSQSEELAHNATNGNEAVQVTNAEEAISQSDLSSSDKEEKQEGAEEAAVEQQHWYFPHRHLHLPLLFTNHRWIVKHLAALPYFTMKDYLRVQQELADQMRQEGLADGMRGLGKGKHGMSDILGKLESMHSDTATEDDDAVGGVNADSGEEDDVIRSDDSPFERERKRKLQEQKAHARQEEIDRERRRQEALLGV